LKDNQTSRTIDELNIGECAFIEKTFSKEDAYRYGVVSKDMNPIHVDEDAASESRFGKIVMQGMLVAGLISAVLGTKLPGEGCIYVSQELNFKKPVFIGDTIRAEVTVIGIDKEKRRCKLSTVCTNQHDETVIQGVAVMIPGA
jgi:3-hydroxybutyryl-CoA dehydratase